MDGLNPILVIAVIMYIIMDITLLRSTTRFNHWIAVILSVHKQHLSHCKNVTFNIIGRWY